MSRTFRMPSSSMRFAVQPTAMALFLEMGTRMRIRWVLLFKNAYFKKGVSASSVLNVRTAARILTAFLSVACGPRLTVPSSHSAEMEKAPFGESLGADALLVSLPSDDNTLVGKVHVVGASADKDLSEVSFQANPCREHLVIQRFPASRHIKDIRRMTTDINSSVLIKVVKIGVGVSNVTDYQYEFDMTEKMVADDTVAYAECCSRLRGGCGGHYVRELYYGQGVYRLLKAAQGEVSAGVPFIADASGKHSYAVLGEQSFRGYFAYKIKETPAPPPPPSVDRLSTVSTETTADLQLPSTLDGAALVEQQGANVIITTQSSESGEANALKAVGEARQNQRRALKNLLAGPPYNIPPATLNERVDQVYQAGREVDASKNPKGQWVLKMSYLIE